jgi:hypothetical protein
MQGHKSNKPSTKGYEMKTKILYLLLIFTILLSACSTGNATSNQTDSSATAQTASTATVTGSNLTDSNTNPQTQNVGQRLPPKEAFDACVGKAEQQSCSFTAAKGLETGTCATVQNQLACSPEHGAGGDQTKNNGTQSIVTQEPGASQQSNSQSDPSVAQSYNIDQAISDKAQGMTISYDALAFMTGDLGADSFFPPGKVADFFGFQYLRDNDPSQMGHAGEFLTSASMNMLNTLTSDQRAELVTLAKSQIDSVNQYGYNRFVLIKAFDRLLSGDLPSGTSSLSEDAVKNYSTQLYQLDGQISFARAQLYGKLIYSLDANQKAYLDAMVGKGMKDWPSVDEPSDVKGLDRDVKVAVMTYAADMFSWYAGSVDADVYFCPERHGTYFGSFYLKDIHAMSDPTYAIPTNLTGDMGETMLKTLNTNQAQLITGLVDLDKPSLQSIVDIRRQISVELRKFKDGGTADSSTVQTLMGQYGAYDGEMIYNMAVHFSEVSQSLTSDQKTQITTLRTELLGDLSHPTDAYLYSQAIPMPTIPNTDFLFK